MIPHPSYDFMKLPSNPWPLAIILTFVLFISGTVGLVVMACSQKVELVSPNYYEQELKFQSQIDRLERTSQPGAQARVAYDTPGQRLTVSLPASPEPQTVRGKIQLYRPSESGLDHQVELRLDASGTQVIDGRDLRAGLWKVRVSWTVDQREYFTEKAIVVPRKTA